MELPEDLRLALQEELRNVPSRDVVTATRELSRRYRERHGRATGNLLRGEADVVAYAAYRMPATYAAVRAVLSEVRDRRPELAPRTLLDLGSGPGTAAWAAAAVWPSLQRIEIVERDRDMIDLGRRLAVHAGSATLRAASWRQADLTRDWPAAPADVTIAAYVVGELPSDFLAPFAERLWDHSREVAVVVEPGTPRGYELVREVGEMFDGHVLAPFPLDWPCLESETDWCHFAERVGRTRVQRTAKSAELAYEDEKYSYIAVSRTPGSAIAARVTRRPQIRSGHVRLTLCTPEGIRNVVVTRSRKEAYRRARDLRWGSAIPPEEREMFNLT